MRRWTLVLAVWTLAGQSAPEAAGAREILEAHNAARRRVGVPAMTWSPRLEGMARQWAEALIANGGFYHNPNSRYGENLFESRGKTTTASQVVGYWISEAPDYDRETNRCAAGKVCGHYTQIVWRNTRQVGCGSARSGRREVWVCSYDPPGNWAGQRPY